MLPIEVPLIRGLTQIEKIGNTKHVWSLEICLWKENPVYFSSIYIWCVGFGILCDDPSQLSPLCFLYWSLLLLWKSPAAYVCFLTFSPRCSRFQLHRSSCLAVCIAHGGIAEDQNNEGCGTGWSKSHVHAVAPSTAGGIRPATQLHRLVPEPTGPWSKTFWKEADGDMNSAACPLHPRPLPCVQHITSTNASHNWCAGMAPSSLDFADWQKHQGHYCSSDLLTILKCRTSSRGVDLLKLLGEYYAHTGFVCLSVWSSGVDGHTVYCLPDNGRYISH